MLGDIGMRLETYWKQTVNMLQNILGTNQNGNKPEWEHTGTDFGQTD